MRFVRPFLVLLGVVASANVRAADATTVTLDQALATVENVNVTVLLSREAAAQAVEQANVTRVGLLPLITGTVQQRRTKAVPLTNTGATSAAPTNRFDELFNGSLSLLDPVRWS